MIDLTPAPTYATTKIFAPPPPICQNCKHWKPDADGEIGVCESPLFADAVWAARDEGSDIVTIPDFACMYWEGKE